MRAFYEAVWADVPATTRPWAFERRRTLLLADARPGERVLDVGCGSGHFAAALVAHGCSVVGTDIAERALERARRTAPEADLRLLEPDGGLPAGHGEFDLAWCSEVLEHVPDAGALLADIRRILRPAGRLLLTTPAHGRLKRVLVAGLRFDAHFDPQGQHVRFYSARSLREHLAVTGFAGVDVRATAGVPALRQTLVARAVRA